jgi:hypothetical protein
MALCTSTESNRRAAGQMNGSRAYIRNEAVAKSCVTVHIQALPRPYASGVALPLLRVDVPLDISYMPISAPRVSSAITITSTTRRTDCPFRF